MARILMMLGFVGAFGLIARPTVTEAANNLVAAPVDCRVAVEENRYGFVMECIDGLWGGWLQEMTGVHPGRWIGMVACLRRSLFPLCTPYLPAIIEKRENLRLQVDDVLSCMMNDEEVTCDLNAVPPRRLAPVR